MKIFFSQLNGKSVIFYRGKIIGRADNVILDTETGEALYLLVIPIEGFDQNEYDLDDQNRLVIPFKKIIDIQDVVVIRR